MTGVTPGPALLAFADRINALLVEAREDLDALEIALAPMYPALAGYLYAQGAHIDVARMTVRAILPPLVVSRGPGPIAPINTVTAIIGSLSRISIRLADVLVNLAELDGISAGTPYLAGMLLGQARILEIAKRAIDRTIDLLNDDDDAPPAPTHVQDRMQINHTGAHPT